MKSFFDRNKSSITSTITAIASVFLAMLSNQLYNACMDAISDNSKPKAKIIVIIAIIVITIIAIFYLSKLFNWIKEKIWPEYADDQYMKHAFFKIRQLNSDRRKCFQEAQKNASELDASFLVQATMQNLQLVVESCYDYFESAFTNTSQLSGSIKFESTFMTKSYRDNEITIPCSANKEKITPLSMNYRKDNKELYKETETAKIYKMQFPKMVLIENTQGDTYKELYDNQKDRIRSSVILPVKSHDNTLLGTLVVHCNQVGFFKKSRYDFWNELLELFSVELAYHKLVLDWLLSVNPDTDKPF